MTTIRGGGVMFAGPAEGPGPKWRTGSDRKLAPHRLGRTPRKSSSHHHWAMIAELSKCGGPPAEPEAC
jgi:hypothetical protein